MKQIHHNGKTLLITTFAIGCMALVLLWPQWRGGLQAQGYGIETYQIDTPVNCNDYCSSNWTMHWACAIGFNFSGACIFEGQGRCRLVGTCYNREDDAANRAACAAWYQQAAQECRDGVASFYCSSENSAIRGWECRFPD
jgi:hypothetical protein